MQADRINKLKALKGNTSYSSKECESIQDTIVHFVNTLLRTSPDYKGEIECNIKPSGAVTLMIGSVEKTAKVPLKEFGVRLEKLKSDEGILSLVKRRQWTEDTLLMVCINELESNIIDLLAEYILFFAGDHQHTDEELDLGIEVFVENYIDKSTSPHQARLNRLLYHSYQDSSCITTEEMDEKYQRLIKAPKSFSHTTRINSKSAAALENAMTFTGREMLGMKKDRLHLGYSQYHMDILQFSLSYILKSNKHGQHYRFSLDAFGSLNRNYLEEESIDPSDLKIKVWVEDEKLRERTARSYYFINKVKNPDWFFNVESSVPDEELDEENLINPDILNVREWIYNSMQYFERIIPIVAQYMGLGLGHGVGNEAKKARVVLFIKLLWVFKFIRIVKDRYKIKNSFFWGCPTGFLRPFNKLSTLFDSITTNFFRRNAIVLGLKLLRGDYEKIERIDEKIGFISTIGDSRVLSRFFPELLKEFELKKYYLSYSQDTLQIFMGVFSLARYLVGRKTVYLDIDIIEKDLLVYLHQLKAYTHKFQEDILNDLSKEQNIFYKKWLSRGFIHGACVFLNNRRLSVQLWDLFSILQPSLASDFILYPIYYCQPLTLEDELVVERNQNKDKAEAMRMAANLLNQDGPDVSEGPIPVFRFGGTALDISEKGINLMREYCNTKYVAKVVPGWGS